MNPLPSTANLLLERRGSNLFVWLNRPETRNALSAETIAELTAVVEYAEREAGALRGIVLRGAGGTFCAGGDIKGFRENLSAPEPAAGERDPIAARNRSYGSFLARFAAVPQCVVVVVEGAAMGGGLGLVCVADAVLCLGDARFAMSETGLGLVPAQIAPFVARRIGEARTRRIGLTGERFGAETARELGLADWVAPDAEALEAKLAEVLAALNKCAPGANAETKRIVRLASDEDLERVLDDAAESFARRLRSDEGREGVRAFLEKRAASWVE